VLLMAALLCAAYVRFGHSVLVAGPILFGIFGLIALAIGLAERQARRRYRRAIAQLPFEVRVVLGADG
jgi:hypothetical protein